MRPPADAKKGPWTSYTAVAEGEAAAAAQQVLKKGPWTAEEDRILREYVRKHGQGNWNALQMNSGLQRCGKSCRLRWVNHLRPNLKKESFSETEVTVIRRLHAEFGNKWAHIAKHLIGRTDNEIKNYWNTCNNRMKKKGLPLNPLENQQQISLNSHGQEQNASWLVLKAPQTIVSSLTSATPLLSENQYGYILQDPNRGKNVSVQLPYFSCPVQNWLGNLDLGPPSYLVKKKLPSSQFSSNYGDEQMPQGNRSIWDDFLQAIDPYGKLGYLDCRLGIHVIADLLATDVPTLIDKILGETTAPTPMIDLPDSSSGGDFSNGSSSVTTDEEIGLDMQQLVWMPSMAQVKFN